MSGTSFCYPKVQHYNSLPLNLGRLESGFDNLKKVSVRINNSQ